MPYCVNCGVELCAGAKRCPLCEVEVVLPDALRTPANGRGLPQKRDVVASAFDRSLWIRVVSVLMIIPALLSVVFNAVFPAELTWWPYVVASLGAVWVWCVSPFLYRRNIVPLWIATDAIALLGLLLVVDALSPNPGWFLPLALPITLCLALLTLLIVTLVWKRMLRGLNIIAATLVAMGLLFMVVEVVVDLYLKGTLRLQWSLLVMVICTPLALIAVMLQRRRGIVEGMKFWFRV
jgi:hypothetical protein